MMNATNTAPAASPEAKIKKVIGNIRNLPTPPIVFEQIQKVLNNPDTSVGDVASILSEDPAMSVKVLKLTNSAFYGLQREIDSVKHAVMIIGLEAVRNLVLSASVLNMFKANEGNKEYHETFWRHSLSAAFACRLVAKNFRRGEIFNPDPAFSTGLIHDIGKMIICCFMQDEHEKIVAAMAENPDKSEYQIESQILGFDHAQLGRELALNWKLPDRMADAIGFHHNPTAPNDSEDFAYLISLGDYVAHMSTIADSDDAPEKYAIAQQVFDFFGLTDEDLAGIRGQLIEEYMKAETFLKIAGLG